MFDNPFGNKLSIPQECDVVFVADLFQEEYLGGAELTSGALIESSPLPVFKLHSRDVSHELLEQGKDKYWIFGNFAMMDLSLIPSIVANIRYSVLEYDYKFCQYRSPEKHEAATGSPCNCNNEDHGKLISAFMYGAQSLWFMSERQQERYTKRFPFLADRENWVLSSVFNDKFFAALKILREQAKDKPRSKWLVLGSDSWIKGFGEAVKWCEANGKEYEVISGWGYEKVLERMSTAEGFVYLPLGGDTCPRMVIEAKLLGCEVVTNDNVEHAREEWFDTDDTELTESYLYAARGKFWNSILHSRSPSVGISGYTTTLDCNRHKYPWRQSITSLLGFCGQVVVVDGGSQDGTWEELQEWSRSEPRLQVHQVLRDWSDPRFAVFDGQQKAEARKRCTLDFLWQQDADEVVHEDDYQKIQSLCRRFPSGIDLLALPVIEYWGGPEKVRADINPWKWRLSRNRPNITHGIPGVLRVTDESGGTYSRQGSDGCDYVDVDTGEPIAFANFYDNNVHGARVAALQGNQGALEAYQNWFYAVTDGLPGVHHYSWFDMERKIKTYRDYWSKHWQSLYNITQVDTSENNMFFDKPWSEVSDTEIHELATRLSSEMGGWIFHQKIDWSRKTPHLTPPKPQPEVMNAGK